MKELFNTDTAALTSRALVNSKNSKYDLEEWILENLPSLSGCNLLDIGCGTGKQLLKVGPLLTSDGAALGVDLSEDAVSATAEAARRDGLEWITAQQMDVDSVPDALSGHRFDVIISTYAIYYSKNLVGLLHRLRSILSDSGVVFLSGPGLGTNKEIIELVNQYLPKEESLSEIPDFLSESELKDLSSSYSRCETVRLNNEVRFNSESDLLSWWRNHNSFRGEAEASLGHFLGGHFSQNDSFALTKNVQGVLLNA